jgi:hypothetical protein
VDNHVAHSPLRWQAHIYGRAEPALMCWCKANNVAIQAMEFTRAHEKAGLKRNALYLLRPDSYVALAAEHPSEELLEKYFRSQKIKP